MTNQKTPKELMQQGMGEKQMVGQPKAIENPIYDEAEKTINEKLKERIKSINEVLKKGEPGNITEDIFNHYTGYKPQYIIDALNNKLGIGMWGFEEISSELIDKSNNGDDYQLVVCKLNVWVGDQGNSLTAYGQARITKGAVGDGYKSAQTDALKKGLSYFSIGNRAYHGLLNCQGVIRRIRLEDK